ncbi:MAG: DUF5689 domain-containing protein [Cyclobacteriaceae bacterium]
MTTRIKETLLFLVLGMGLGCAENDDTNPQPAMETLVVANFETITEEIAFEKEQHEVTILLDKTLTSTSDMTLSVSGSAVYGQHFTTIPGLESGRIRLTVDKGSQFAKLTINRMEDHSEDHKTVIVNIHKDGSDIQPGVQSSTTLVLKKKEMTEEPNTVQISFVESLGYLSLDEPNGLDIGLHLSANVPHTIPVKIEIKTQGDFQYGSFFTTEPQAVLGELTLEAVPGVSNYSFRVVPVSNLSIEGSRTISFTILATEGGITTGPKDTFTLLIEKGEPSEVDIQKLSELRNKFNIHQGSFWISDDYYIEGIVTSGQNVSDKRVAYIEDNSAAIMLRFTADNILNTGDKIRLNLKGATGQVINGQKAMTDVADRAGIVLSKNAYLDIPTISPEQFASGAFEGRKIRVKNVRFEAANGSNSFSENNILIADNRRLILKVYPNAGFSDKIIPQGSLSIVGIIGDWGYLQPQDFNRDFLQ